MSVLVNDTERLITAIRQSGRLREQDHALIARAVNLIINDRAKWPNDATEALVQAIATLAVTDAEKLR